MNLTELFETHRNPVKDPLWDDLANMIRQKNDANPRHLQVELGPSEIGHPCMRRMAYGMMQVPRCNPEYDPLPSIYGTAMHSWLEKAAQYDNEVLGRERWITESRVTPVHGLSGSSDLYDTDTQTVIDWKNLGLTSYDKLVKEMTEQYKGQLMLYGKGFQNAGYIVKDVVIAILPRARTLQRMHIWRHPYDDAYANNVLAKRHAVMAMIDDLDVEIVPERYQWIPNTPGDCVWCPWWRPEPRSPLQCRGTL